jgi:hypothetical protein
MNHDIPLSENCLNLDEPLLTTLLQYERVMVKISTDIESFSLPFCRPELIFADSFRHGRPLIRHTELTISEHMVN